MFVTRHGPPLLTKHHRDGRRVGLEGADRDPIHTIEGDRMRAQYVVRQGGFTSKEPQRSVG